MASCDDGMMIVCYSPSGRRLPFSSLISRSSVFGQRLAEHQGTDEGGGEGATEDAELGFVEHLSGFCAEVGRIAQGGNEHGDGEADAADHADAGKGLPVATCRHLTDAELDAEP